MKKLSITARMAALFLIIGFIFSFSAQVSAAKEVEFEFYYQNIEKVIQINEPEPSGWWEFAKSTVKKGINIVKQTWESNVARRYFPGEGKKTWYSKKDPNLAYEVNRTKVTSESQLMKLMGAGSEAELTDGQKALLAVYRHSKSQAVKDRAKYNYQSSIKVMLSDTTGFDNSSEYPNVRKDFWPYSQGNLIQMSSGRYNYPGSDDDSQSTFVHEYSHSMDRTIKEIINPYGKDGSHYSNELTAPRAAFVEGWAEFNEMLDSEDEVRAMENSIKRVRLESKSTAGDYTQVKSDSPDLSGKDLMSVEGINAMILYRMATEIPDGKEKVFKAFTSTRWKLFRNLKSMSKYFARKYPEDAAKLAEIFNDETFGKLSDRELMGYVGSSDSVKNYIAQRDLPVTTDVAAPMGSSTQSAPSASAAAPELPENALTAQDFSISLQKAHELAQNALRAYTTAIQNGAAAEECTKLQQELVKRKSFLSNLLKIRKHRR